MIKYKKRVREIPLKNSSLAGVINVSLINQSVQFESSLERDYIYLLEFDIEVDQYLEQPIEIPYQDTKGNKRKYIPDFVVDYYNRPTEIVEIKYESTLNTNYDELVFKFKAAEKFCKESDLNF